MTTFAPNRDTLESFVDCIHGGVDENTLTRLLAENVDAALPPVRTPKLANPGLLGLRSGIGREDVEELLVSRRDPRVELRGRAGTVGQVEVEQDVGYGALVEFTLAAILWANSPWADSYWALLDTHVGFSFGDHTVELTVKHLINDGLMTFFFFIVGLEVKSQFTIGELTDRARAAVPVVAARPMAALPPPD